MKFEKWHIGLIVVILVILVASLVWYFRSPAEEPEILGNQTGEEESVESFDETAKVMFFYSDGCGWCNQQKEVLAELAKEGYRVRPMDVGADPQLFEKYNLQGTPTFISDNGKQLVGFREKEELKAWLDKYK